jgi:hypothetical protein
MCPAIDSGGQGGLVHDIQGVLRGGRVQAEAITEMGGCGVLQRKPYRLRDSKRLDDLIEERLNLPDYVGHSLLDLVIKLYQAAMVMPTR